MPHRFTRNKERQLWLMLLTIAMTANTFLLLFLQSPWVPPGSLTADYLLSLDHQHRTAQLSWDPPVTRKEIPQRLPEPAVKALDGLVDDSPAKEDWSDHDEADDRAPPDPLPKLVDTEGEEEPASTTTTRPPKKTPVPTTKRPARTRKPVPVPAPKKPDSKATTRLPWLEHPKDVPRLEQVIRSLRVMAEDDDSDWKQSSYFEPRSKLVTVFRPEVLVNSVRCPSGGPHLLVVVPSVGFSVKARQAVRGTWASPLYGEAWPGEKRNFTALVKVVFFLGVKTQGKSPALEDEARKFGDIVQMDFQESYRNLSFKMALAVEWSSTYCPGAAHVMKVDEDTFVDVPLLLDVLKHLEDRGPSPRFVLGFQHFKERPPVNRAGKWGVSKDLYPFQHFPRYVYGHSYVLSSEAVKGMKSTWRCIPLVPNEDAFMTGVLAKVAGVSRIHCDWFAREDFLYPVPLPKKELALGRSVSQTGFKPLQKLYEMWDLVFEAYDNATASAEET